MNLHNISEIIQIKINMGCCHNNQKIINPGPNRRPSAFALLKENLSSITELLLQEYENHLSERINPDQPRTFAEFNQITNNLIERTLSKYDLLTKDLNKNILNISQIKFYKHYLNSKCKAKESLFSNQNSFNSFKYIFKLIETLLSKLQEGCIDEKQSTEAFLKLAKGAYMIRGLQVYHNLLGIGFGERMKLLKTLEDNENQILVEEKNQLIGLYKDSLLPGTQMIIDLKETAKLERKNSISADSFYSKTKNEFFDLNEIRIRRFSASQTNKRKKDKIN